MKNRHIPEGEPTPPRVGHGSYAVPHAAPPKNRRRTEMARRRWECNMSAGADGCYPFSAGLKLPAVKVAARSLPTVTSKSMATRPSAQTVAL